MPLLFLGTGLVLIVAGVKGNPTGLWTLIKSDFSGTDSFVYWMTSILALGALGYVPQLKNLSRLFIILVLVVLVLDNKGFFAQLQSYLNSTSSSSTSSTAAPSTTSSASTGGAS